MTSMFDSNVRDRRNHTPWAKMSLTGFMRDMATNTTDFEKVTLTCQWRHAVSSRYWWTIEWTDEQGETRIAESQELDLCLWRAAEIELRVRNKTTASECPAERPIVVCLCGSTRFSEAFHEANLRETLAGRIVLSIGCDTKSDRDLQLAGQLNEEDKARLDELHLRKIDLADEVLILNVGNYIGASTARELAYAIDQGKFIRWWEEPSAPVRDFTATIVEESSQRRLS